MKKVSDMCQFNIKNEIFPTVMNIEVKHAKKSVHLTVCMYSSQLKFSDR
jgi:hypothetical protein